MLADLHNGNTQKAAAPVLEAIPELKMVAAGATFVSSIFLGTVIVHFWEVGVTVAIIVMIGIGPMTGLMTGLTTDQAVVHHQDLEVISD